MRVGFVGLGVMGAPMAAKLARAGMEVLAYSRSGTPDAVVEAGATAVSGLDEVATGADVVLLMLPDTSTVESVLFDSGLAQALRTGAILVDMSSISPVATRNFAARLEARHVRYLDAPVSGGEIGARQGTLTIFVGGDEQAFSEMRLVFSILGDRVTWLGPAGSGQTVKTANQMMVAANLLGVAEACRLLQAAGISLPEALVAIEGGFAHSRVLEVHGPRMANLAFEPGFRARLHLKDLRIAADAAAERGLSLPGLTTTLSQFEKLVAGGLGEADHSALFLNGGEQGRTIGRAP